MMFSELILQRADELVMVLNRKRLTITTAESCTGGLICGALTAIPGSSSVVYGGFVTYANNAKKKMIGVPEMVLANQGAVSEATVRAMAEGARRATETDIAVAVTGIAGPGGGSPSKPVGLVHLGCATAAGTYHKVQRFGDIGRQHVREKAVIAALELVLATQLTESHRATKKPDAQS
jgi:nicotinamide-nucleotide amidase